MNKNMLIGLMGMVAQTFASYGEGMSSLKSQGYNMNIPTAKSSFKQNDRQFRKISARKKARSVR